MGLVSLGELAEETGITVDVIDPEVTRLLESGFLRGECRRVMGPADHWCVLNPVLTEKGARAIGMWPSEDPYEALVALLESRIREETDEDQRSRLRKLRDSLREVGKGVAVGVLTELVKLGLPR